MLGVYGKVLYVFLVLTLLALTFLDAPLVGHLAFPKYLSFVVFSRLSIRRRERPKNYLGVT